MNLTQRGSINVFGASEENASETSVSRSYAYNIIHDEDGANVSSSPMENNLLHSDKNGDFLTTGRNN
jgi:hypothetical protein